MMMKKTLAERFDNKYLAEPMSGCWLWEGANAGNVKGQRYGVIYMGRGKRLLAHRASWMLHRGTIPDGLNILHKCDNPACVNPDHLFVGTQQENIADMKRKGRADRVGKAFGEDIGSCKLTGEQVDQIRLLDASMRRCDIAEMFGVSRGNVTMICQGKTWKQRQASAIKLYNTRVQPSEDERSEQ